MPDKQYWQAFTVVDEQRPDLGGNCRHGDSLSITPNLWRYLVERFAPYSMLDVGCGEGHALAAFQRLGVIAHGIDGLAQQHRSVRHPFAIHDLTQQAYRYPCDLVYCVEVVEHLQERYLANLMDTLCNAPVVVMTHAVPGQNGHHHVNLKPQSYWLEQFQQRGYFLAPDNEHFKAIAASDVVDAYFAQTGLVLIKP